MSEVFLELIYSSERGYLYGFTCFDLVMNVETCILFFSGFCELLYCCFHFSDSLMSQLHVQFECCTS